MWQFLISFLVTWSGWLVLAGKTNRDLFFAVPLSEYLHFLAGADVLLLLLAFGAVYSLYRPALKLIDRAIA